MHMYDINCYDRKLISKFFLRKSALQQDAARPQMAGWALGTPIVSLHTQMEAETTPD